MAYNKKLREDVYNILDEYGEVSGGLASEVMERIEDDLWDQCPLCEHYYPVVVPSDQVCYCPWCGGELLP